MVAIITLNGKAILPPLKPYTEDPLLQFYFAPYIFVGSVDCMKSLQRLNEFE